MLCIYFTVKYMISYKRLWVSYCTNIKFLTCDKTDNCVHVASNFPMHNIIYLFISTHLESVINHISIFNGIDCQNNIY